MFSKQNQTNVEEARDAVKKQLLRSLMQQVVEEFNTSDDDSMREMIESIVSEVDMGSVKDRIHSAARDRIQSELEKSDLESLIDERLQAHVSELEVQIADRLQADFDAKVQQAQANFDQHAAEKLSNALASRESADMFDVDAEIDAMIQTKLEEISSSELWSNTLQKVDSKVSEAATSRFRETVESQNLSESVDLEMEMDQLVANRLDGYLASEEWTAIQASTEKTFQDKLTELVQENTVSTERLESEVSDKFNRIVEIDEQLFQKNIETAESELSEKIAKELTGRLHASENIVIQSLQSIQNESDVFDAATSRVREALVEQIAKHSLTQIQDVDRIASEARDQIAFDNDSLITSISLVRSTLIKDIARRSLVSLSDADRVNADAQDWIDENDPHILKAVAEVVQHVNEIVGALSRQQIANTESVVNHVLPMFSPKDAQIKAAVKATWSMLTDQIVTFTLSELNDNNRMASEAVTHISADNEAFQAAVRSTMSLLMDDIVQETQDRMSSAEKISSDVRRRMDDVPSEVLHAADVLENMMLSEVSDMTRERLYDVQRASEKARTFLKAQKEIDTVEESVRGRIYREIAEQVVLNLSDSKTAGNEAFTRIDHNHENIQNAIAELRTQLVFRIAKESVSRLEDSDAIARESRRLIPGTSFQMTGAISKLYDILVGDISRQSLNLITETDKSVKDALSHMEDDHEVFSKVRGIVHDRMIESLLANALSEIGDRVTGAGDAGEREFFQDAIQQIKIIESKPGEVEASAPVKIDAPAPVPAVSPDLSSAGSPVSEPIQTAQPAPSPPSNWTPLSEIESGEQETAEKNWKVTEFRPIDREPKARHAAGDGAAFRTPKLKPRKGTDTTIYVYGVVRTEDVNKDAFEGMEGISADSDIQFLSCGRMTAIVSQLQDESFSPFAIRSTMRDTEWLKEHVAQHAGILAEVKDFMTVIPLRFGCVFSLPEEVKTFIDERESLLLESLDRLNNKSEFGIRVLCNVELLRKRLADDASSTESLTGMPAGVASFLQSNQENAEDSMGDFVSSLSSRIYGDLKRGSSEALRKEILIAESDSGDHVLLNATFLVAQAKEAQFRSKALSLASEYESQGIQIEVSGPWPPYHFVDLDSPGQGGFENTPV